jgi:hypothetical protein
MQSCTPWVLDAINATLNAVTTVAVSYISYKYGRSQERTDSR